MTYGEAEKMVKKTLSKKRFTHTVNVKDKAVELARLYGASEERISKQSGRTINRSSNSSIPLME